MNNVKFYRILQFQRRMMFTRADSPVGFITIDKIMADNFIESGGVKAAYYIHIT